MALSLRGQEALKQSKSLLLWEVIQNLWDPQTNPLGYVSLGVAENSLMHEVLSQHIHDNIALPLHAFTYGDGASGSKRLKAVMARFLTKQLKPVLPIKPAHITVTNGCSAAIEHLSWALANPGDGFLLGRPFYGTFLPDISMRPGVRVVTVPFHGVDPLSIDAVQKYEDVLLDANANGQKISGLVICNPHNPLGRCYPRDVLVGLMQLCQKYQIHFISDEIYALSVWSNTMDKHPQPVPFESCLSIGLTNVIDASRVHILWGMSKDFGANGIRIGAIISQHNAALHTALVPVALYSSSSSISDHATANILEDEAWVEAYMTENRRKLARHYEAVVDWARKHDIVYAPGANAAFFLWVDLGRSYRRRHPDKKIDDIGEEVMQALLRKKVFLASGEQFGSEQPGWFRIVFSQARELLDEGLKRIIIALDE